MENSNLASFENSRDEQSEYFGMLSDEDMAIDSDLIDGKHVDKKDANSRSFPNILMEILSNDDYFECIHWCSDGKAFEISNPEKLATNILPVYFKTSKYTSFTRKLYRWGFQMNDLQEQKYFYNKNFLRDKKDLLSGMRLHYSPKELRLKKAKKSISKKSVIRMLNTEKKSFAQDLQIDASFNHLQLQTQTLNAQSNLQIPQTPLASMHAALNVALQQPPQEHFLNVPSISSNYLLSQSSFQPSDMSDNPNNNSQVQPQSSGLIVCPGEKFDAKQLQSNECELKESAITSELSGFHKVSSQPSNKKSLNGNSARMEKVKDSYVQHDYHDYSWVLCKDVPSNCHSSYHMNHKGGNDILFPQKLHALISHATISDQDAISWAPHGRCFSIKNREKFMEKYLTPTFHMKTFPSFQRQLNRYNFKSITRFGSKDRGSFYHELFLRSRPGLSQYIRGVRKKGNGFKPLPSPQDEPDFYSFPPCYEINQELVAPNNPSPYQYNSSIVSKDSIAMTNFSTLQDASQRSTSINYFPSTSIGNPMAQCMLQSGRTENIPMSNVDRMVTMPILPGRLQSAGVLNTSFPLIANQNHGYFTTQIDPSCLHKPVPLPHNSSNALLFERSIALLDRKNTFPQQVIKDEKSERTL